MAQAAQGLHIAPYDPQSTLEFEAERERIAQVLGGSCKHPFATFALDTQKSDLDFRRLDVVEAQAGLSARTES